MIGRAGHATRSPRFRFLQKLEAQNNDRNDRSRIEYHWRHRPNSVSSLQP